MRIYLAIPYSGMEKKSFETANKAAADLMQAGHIVFSPISHSHPIAVQCGLPGDWLFWRKFDESFLEWCDCMMIVPIDGWRQSKGVTMEREIATALGKPIEFYRFCAEERQKKLAIHGGS